MAEARSADPTLPPVDALEEIEIGDQGEEESGGWSFTGVGIAGLCLAIAIVAYRFLRANRQ
jgi:hypothetical protein